MQQYFEVKSRYPSALLFYRMGDFYELFFDDAAIAAEVLDIALTKRGKHDGADIPMCGVPVHAADQYLQKLITSGHHVAICDQLETPEEAKKRGYKAVLRRDVIRLVTPSTITEEGLLDAKSPSFMLALARGEKTRLACAWAEMSTGAFFIEHCQESELAGLIARIEPKEILLAEEEGASGWLKGFTTLAPSWLSPHAFDAKSGKTRAMRHWSLASAEGLPEYDELSFSAIGAVLHYLEITQLSARTELMIPKPSLSSDVLRLDATTRRSLELTQTQFAEKKGSFLWAIDETKSAAGGRALLARLQAPSRHLPTLLAWQAQVTLLLADGQLRQKLRDMLAQLPDLERALTRLRLARGGPRDLLAIRQGLSVNNYINECLYKKSSSVGLEEKSILDGWLDGLAGHTSLLQTLSEALKEDVPLLTRDGGFIAAGYRPDLDQFRTLRDESKRVMIEMEQNLRARTGISSLKIKHNNMLGYFVEVTSIHESKIPTDFIRRQGLAGSLRYTTPELSDLARKIDEAAEQALQMELLLFEELCKQLCACSEALRTTAQTLAQIDVAAALAELAAREGYCKPHIVESGELRIHGGRHPVVEATLRRDHQEFQPNDCALSAQMRCWLITGPNMGGKSTFLRQNALIVLLAHMGSYVPAKQATIPLIDQIFSRVGAADDLARGKSTFMVEMTETAAILHQATEHSFVILDEIGRGTATYDGIAIASAVIRYLLSERRSLVLFATHYHELTALANEYAALANYRADAREHQGNLIFMHRMLPGTADRSYGIQVAALAGLPKQVILQAKQILGSLEISAKEHNNTRDLPLLSFEKETIPDPEPQLHPLAEALNALDIDELTPKEALETLYQWKKKFI